MKSTLRGLVVTRRDDETFVLYCLFIPSFPSYIELIIRSIAVLVNHSA